MSTVTVKYLLSQAARRRLAVETGEEPPRENSIAVDLAPLSAAQRAQLLDARSKITGTIAIEKATPKTYPDSGDAWYWTMAEMENILSGADDVLAASAGGEAMKAAAQAEQIRLRSEANAKHIAAYREFLAGGQNPGQNVVPWSGAAGHDELVDLLPLVEAERARRAAEAAAKHAAEQAAEKAVKEAAQAEKLAWAKASGSERLVRGLEAGHTCTRLYVIERAAAEYPEYVVDYNDAAGWQSRACPSLEALDELTAVKAAHPQADAQIVWLTEPAANAPAVENSDEYEPEEFEPREAVIVSGYLEKYDLVKHI